MEPSSVVFLGTLARNWVRNGLRLELQPVLIRDGSVTGGGLTYCATIYEIFDKSRLLFIPSPWQHASLLKLSVESRI